MLNGKITCDPSVLLKTIKEKVHQNTFFNKNSKLIVSVLDYQSIEESLGSLLREYGWVLISDENLHQGGFKIVTDDGEIDASLSSRWEELCHLAFDKESR
jgi:flagellar assembly protein FliH